MITLIISIVFLIIISAFFSGSETGLTGSSRAKIHQLKIEGNKRAKMVSRLREEKDNLIGTILLGNNAVNIAASALATKFAIDSFPDDPDSAVLYVTIIMTFIVLVFAEVMPKNYAFRNSEKVALLVAPIFIVLVKIFTPITILVQLFVDILMKIFGFSVQKDDDTMSDTNALRGAIALHHDEGAVVKSDRDMLGSILDLADMEVGEVMLHRKEMETLDKSTPSSEIIKFVLNSRYTRIPVWEDNSDNIIGVLHSKRLMRALKKTGGNTDNIDIEKLVSTPWFVPETTTLKNQLHAFRQKHNHFALVVDEYGVLLGMVTLEDILEEIVGQIDDEYDASTKIVNKQKDGSYLVEGSVTIRDLNRELDWNLPDEEAATIAGLIIHEAQLIPDVGQVFVFHGYRFEIKSKNRNQITNIRVSRGKSAV